MNWSGKVFLWEEQGLFIGLAGTADLHESPAIKICISLASNFQLRTSETADWQNYTSAIIPAGQLHAIGNIGGLGNKMAMFLLAPEGELGQLLIPATSENGIAKMSDAALKEIRPLLDSFETPEINGDEGEAIYREVIEKIAAENTSENKNTFIDPRVFRSIEWIRAERENGISVKEIAAGVELSESRFSHLFTEHVRIPVRRYLLWLRLRDALHLLAGTGSLTETAHSAGFADSAHLTRTFRTSLGITPSALVKESSLVSFLK